MEFSAFADRALAIEETDADLEVVAAVASLFEDADDDLATVARFVQGRPFPAWDDRQLAVGPATCRAALARAAGPNVDADEIEERLATVGDIGEVASSLDLSGQRGLGSFGNGDDALTVETVRAELAAMAAATGDGSEGRRRDRLFGLFTRASPTEARFVARLVLEEMRIGVGDGTVRDAVAGAFLADDWPTTRSAAASEPSDDSATEPTTNASEAAAESDGTGEASDDGQLTLVEAATDADTAASEDRNGIEEDEAVSDDSSEGREDSSEGREDSSEVREDSSEVRDGDAGATGEAGGPSLSRPPADAIDPVERALQVTNDYGRVAEVARDEGASGLGELELEVGRPVQAMLAQAGQVTDTIREFDGVAVETKYDGARVQIHYDPADGTRLFSRNMADVTDALPEIVEFVADRVDVPVILDGEVIAMDGEDVLPFQRVLERFRRKHDVAKAREDVAVELRAFDCLHYDGTELLDTPLRERREYLERALDGGMATYAVMYDPEKIDAFEAAVLDAGHEGIMLKDPDSTYSAGKRGREWLKRKPDVETLDLVVTGAEWGEGRRANVFGTFEVAARRGDVDGDASEYAPIGHVATGITDAELESLTDRLREHVAREDGQSVTFDSVVVFEVGYEEIQRSPTTDSGYALRFPRFVAVREDKAPADADDLERVEGLQDT